MLTICFPRVGLNPVHHMTDSHRASPTLCHKKFALLEALSAIFLWVLVVNRQELPGLNTSPKSSFSSLEEHMVVISLRSVIFSVGCVGSPNFFSTDNKLCCALSTSRRLVQLFISFKERARDQTLLIKHYSYSCVSKTKLQCFQGQTFEFLSILHRTLFAKFDANSREVMFV